MPLPDLIEIVPLTAPVRAEITVPGSKSITNRALVLAALADGEVTLQGALWSEDTQVMVECLQELGYMVNVARDSDEACNRTITVYGLGGRVPRGGTVEQPLELFVGNAGTVARFLAAMVCLGDGVYRLHGVPRMHERPQAALFQALRELGYRVEAENGNDKLPAMIFGGRADLPVGQDAQQRVPTKRACTVSIEDSSQFASALVLGARMGGWDVKVVGENAEESPYVAMTSEMVKVFPHRGGKFQIEPDASSGSYFFAAAVYGHTRDNAEPNLIAEGDALTLTENFVPFVSVRAWPSSRWQVDENFSEVMFAVASSSIGFGFEDEVNMILNYGPDWRDVQEVDRDFDFKPPVLSRREDLGDSIMTAIAIAPFGIHPFHFTNLGRLRVQECERVVALRTELTKCGAKVVEEGDTLTVHPSTLHGAEIETYNDHRMAMCFAILGLKVPGIKLKNPACVKKTFPNFFQKLATASPHGLGATILDGHTGRKLALEELFAD